MSLELVGFFQALSQSQMVVDLSVHSENDSVVLVDERLGTGVYRIISLARTLGGERGSPTPTMARRSCTSTVSLLM